MAIMIFSSSLVFMLDVLTFLSFPLEKIKLQEMVKVSKEGERWKRSEGEGNYFKSFRKINIKIVCASHNTQI